jgi:ethanolamine ammonia-lyase large subunit
MSPQHDAMNRGAPVDLVFQSLRAKRPTTFGINALLAGRRARHWPWGAARSGAT